MKNFTLLLTVLLLPFLGQAAQVDQATARTIGEHFLQRRAVPTVRSASAQLDLVERMTSAGIDPADMNGVATYYYVFNLHGSTGFVIVAGDDAVTPILGYSDHNAYDATQLPENMAKWMEGYKNAIAAVVVGNVAAPVEISAQWEALAGEATQNRDGDRSVNPLLQTQWDQSPYYNDQCPFDAGQNQRTVTGCVATAMAQIMKYWNYPATGTGFHSYNEPHYGTLSANFAATTYAWASMPNSVNSSNSAVATLMNQVGVGVDMSYGVASTGGSSAFVISAMSTFQNCAEYALRTYFGYDSTLQGLQRANYADLAWINLMKGELDNNRPILYAGFGTGGGHCFDLDGYDNSNLFHVNWGWGGQDNGYFAITGLNPANVGIGGGDGDFNNNQQAVIGIQPPSGSQTYDMRLYDYVTPVPSTIYYGQSFTVTTNIWNAGLNTFNGDYCTALFDSQNNFVDYVEILSGQSLSAGNVYSQPLGFIDSSYVLVPGTYYIAAFYRPTNGDWHEVADNGFYSNMVQFNVIDPNDVEMYASMNVLSGLPLVDGTSVSVNLDVANFGASDIIADFDLSLYNLQTNQVFNIGQDTNLAICSPCHFIGGLTFNSAPLNVAPGTYLMAVTYHTDTMNGFWEIVGATNYSNPILVTVQEAPIGPDIYELDNTYATAQVFTPTYLINTANVNTVGSNCDIGTDNDFYRIDLPAGYDYTISARLNDSYNSGDGNTYTLDALFSYSTDNVNWSAVYDDVMPGNINLSGGTPITFHAAPYFEGSTGTYDFNADITRFSALGITGGGSISDDFQLVPNPATDRLTIEFNDHSARVLDASLMNAQGQELQRYTSRADVLRMTVDVSALAQGIYYVQVRTPQGIGTKPFVKTE